MGNATPVQAPARREAPSRPPEGRSRPPRRTAKKPSSDPVKTRDIVIRCLVAALVGYALSAVICLWAGVLFSLSADDARRLTNMLFFVVYTGVIIWVFSAARVSRVVCVSLGALILLGAGWYLLPGGVS